jgi:hypothetical protein
MNLRILHTGKPPGGTLFLPAAAMICFPLRILHMQIIIARNGFVKRQYAFSEYVFDFFR